MSDKPIVKDFDYQVAPGVDAHTHEVTKAGKHSYEHKAETGFEGPNVTGSAYEKTKITLADEPKPKHVSSSDHHTSGGLLGLGSGSHHESSHTGAVATGATHTELDTRHTDSSLTGSNKPVERDYDYQPAPGVQAHTHEVTKTGKNTYEHKAETTFEGPNTVGSAYEKTTVKMSSTHDAHAK